MAEPLNATFFALRKREGSLLLGASVVFTLVAALLWAGYIYLNWSALPEVGAWFMELMRLSAASAGNVSPDAMPQPPRGIIGVFGGLLLLLIPYNILLASYEAACLRWMIHAERPGLFGLTLGADTWRVWGVYWVWFALNMGASLVIGLIAIIVALAMGGPDVLRPYQDWIELAWNAMLWLIAIRLIPAAATSVGLRRFAFFKAWTVTRERYFALLGSFVLWGLIYVVLTLIVYGAGFAMMWPKIGDDIMALTANPTVDSVLTAAEALFAPPNLIFLVATYALFAPVATLMLVLYYGINARAVRAALDEEKIEPASA